MICAQGLTKAFGNHQVLDHVDLTIGSGERVAVIGLNGAGKTTLFRCLLGLTPFEGNLSIGDADVGQNGREARAHIGYVPQRAPHFDGTLAEMIDFFCRLRSTPIANVHRHLRGMGLEPDTHADKPVRVLSGGMLQKVLLALALGSNVSVLLLDEPTANLDPRARREFLKALKLVPADTTILLSSHQLADIEAVTDRVLVLHDHKLVFTGQLSELDRQLSDEVALWLDIPEEARGRASAALEESEHVRGILGVNGAVGVRVPGTAGADVVHHLRQLGVPIRDFWIERPSVEDFLEGLLSAPDKEP